MNNEDLIDDWDNEDYEVFNQWDEEAKNKRLEELKEYFKSDMEIRKGLIDRIKGQEKQIKELKSDLLYVLEQLDGYLDKGWTIDLNFTYIREKYKEDIKEYETWNWS